MKKNDTNRLANRGGALLKEEKIRKGISKELPKVKIVYVENYVLTFNNCCSCHLEDCCGFWEYSMIHFIA